MTASGEARILSPVRASITTISDAAEFMSDLMCRTSLLWFAGRELAVGSLETTGVSLGRGAATCAVHAIRRKASAKKATRRGRMSICFLIQDARGEGSQARASGAS